MIKLKKISEENCSNCLYWLGTVERATTKLILLTPQHNGCTLTWQRNGHHVTEKAMYLLLMLLNISQNDLEYIVYT